MWMKFLNWLFKINELLDGIVIHTTTPATCCSQWIFFLLKFLNSTGFFFHLCKYQEDQQFHWKLCIMQSQTHYSQTKCKIQRNCDESELEKIRKGMIFARVFMKINSLILTIYIETDASNKIFTGNKWERCGERETEVERERQLKRIRHLH